MGYSPRNYVVELTRAVIPSDIDYIAENMRTDDIDELSALGFKPKDALVVGHSSSTLDMTLVCPKTGLPGAILGVTKLDQDLPDGPSLGSIWLLGTPLIEQNTVCFLRQSKITLPSLFSETGCDALGNYVYEKNALHIKWLRWLGFKFLRRVQMGPLNETFIEFVQVMPSV